MSKEPSISHMVEALNESEDERLLKLTQEVASYHGDVYLQWSRPLCSRKLMTAETLEKILIEAREASWMRQALAARESDLCYSSTMRCPTCGKTLLGRAIHEVADMYACTHGHYYCVVTDDGISRLHTDGELNTERKEKTQLMQTVEACQSEHAITQGELTACRDALRGLLDMTEGKGRTDCWDIARKALGVIS